MTVLLTVSLLIFSNIFMTVAWYAHLRFMDRPLWLIVVASWGVALFEYCLQVPANRIGYHTLSAFQLKTLQEVITLTVFVLFAQIYLGESLRPKHLVGFVLLALAAWTVFQDHYGLDW
jgi:uncharacterized protein (DUF486 family)